MGAFSSIYHPVGIPMLVRGTTRPGLAIGVNGLAGNLGVALAAVTTGLLVKYIGWRAAFVVPAFLAIACGVLFARVAPRETGAAVAWRAGTRRARRGAARAHLRGHDDGGDRVEPAASTSRPTATASSCANALAGIVEDPALLGALLACVYVVASFAQVAIGLLIDRYPHQATLPRRRGAPGAALHRPPRARTAGRCSRCRWRS